MSMEKETWSWKLLLLLILSLISFTLSSNFPSQGCYWTEECLHKWHGDCGGLVYNQSTNCHGKCQPPKYSPCPPYHTHFYCCSAGSPMKVKDGCVKCESKMDDGDEFVCCSDCTYPEMVYGDTSSGYCKSGALLISQPKPKEVFKWVAGPWLPCSAPCGGGIRSRRVECFAVIEDTSSPDYPVYDDLCSHQEKLTGREACNVQSCVAEVVNRKKEDGRHGRTSPIWIILGLLTGGIVLGFGGFILFKRITSSQANNNGYVYIMMDGFS
ncbi:uncharacterized protein LOC141612669 [Silene latifolia]|uniref:uncharacterized protein LOC141612669 n=1 Tax=Silene latifolia TaxID=37657 RepID=UPI003D786969